VVGEAEVDVVPGGGEPVGPGAAGMVDAVDENAHERYAEAPGDVVIAQARLAQCVRPGVLA